MTLSPSVKYLDEGSSFDFTVYLKNKTFNEDIVVSITAIPRSASPTDFNILLHNVTIKAGDTSAVYTVYIIEDDVPEMLEEFHLVLNATSGDTVIHSNFTAVVFIRPNDDPGGVIQFAKPLSSVLSFKEKDVAPIRFIFYFYIFLCIKSTISS